MASSFNPLPEYWSALDDKTKRGVLLVKKAQLASVLPCLKCQALLDKCMSTVDSKAAEFAPDDLRRGTTTIATPGSAPLHNSSFVLQRLPDGSWISEDYLPGKAPGQPGSPSAGTDAGSGSAASGKQVRYSFRPRDQAFDFAGTLDGAAALTALVRDFSSPTGGPSRWTAERALACTSSMALPLALLHPPPAAVTATTSGPPQQEGQPVIPPTSSCWYCADKLWVKFMDMTTYPKPPRKFVMLLCRDDRVRALRQVLSAEVEAAGGGLALVWRGREIGRLHEDEKATMASLEVKTGAMILITKKQVKMPPVAAIEDDVDCVDADRDGSRECDDTGSSTKIGLIGLLKGIGPNASGRPLTRVPPEASPVWVDWEGEGSGGVTSSPLGAAAASHLSSLQNAALPSASTASNGPLETGKSQHPELAAITAGLGSGNGADSDAYTSLDIKPKGPRSSASKKGKPQASAVLSSSSTAELLDQLLHGNGSSAGQPGDKGPGAINSPVSSVDRRHGFSILGSMLSVVAAGNVVAVWKADADARALQDALIAEEEQAEAAKSKGKGKGKGKDKDGKKGKEKDVKKEKEKSVEGDVGVHLPGESEPLPVPVVSHEPIDTVAAGGKQDDKKGKGKNGASSASAPPSPGGALVGQLYADEVRFVLAAGDGVGSGEEEWQSMGSGGQGRKGGKGAQAPAVPASNLHESAGAGGQGKKVPGVKGPLFSGKGEGGGAQPRPDLPAAPGSKGKAAKGGKAQPAAQVQPQAKPVAPLSVPVQGTGTGAGRAVPPKVPTLPSAPAPVLAPAPVPVPSPPQSLVYVPVSMSLAQRGGVGGGGSEGKGKQAGGKGGARGGSDAGRAAIVAPVPTPAPTPAPAAPAAGSHPRFCSECGSGLPALAKFCSSCGVAVRGGGGTVDPVVAIRSFLAGTGSRGEAEVDLAMAGLVAELGNPGMAPPPAPTVSGLGVMHMLGGHGHGAAWPGMPLGAHGGGGGPASALGLGSGMTLAHSGLGRGAHASIVGQGPGRLDGFGLHMPPSHAPSTPSSSLGDLGQDLSSLLSALDLSLDGVGGGGGAVAMGDQPLNPQARDYTPAHLLMPSLYGSGGRDQGGGGGGTGATSTTGQGAGSRRLPVFDTLHHA